MNASVKRNSSPWIFICTMAVLFVVQTTEAASFDCAKVQTKIEKIICSDPELSISDNVLAGIYHQALEQSTDKQQATKEQRHWLKSVRNICQDANCLKDAYQARIENLQQASTLCKPQEVIIFSCSLPDMKIVSLCASKDADVNSGYMQYRFGRGASFVEFEYPQKKRPAKEFFKYYPPAKIEILGGTYAISFWLGEYRYSLFSTRTRFGYNGSGVIVSRGKEPIRVSFSKCVTTPLIYDEYEMYSAISFRNLRSSLGLQEAGNDISFYGGESNDDAGSGSAADHPKPGEPENYYGLKY